MKQIPITQGQVALVDDEDYERVSKYKWQAGWRPNICSWYAVADGNLYLHRFIMDAKADEQIGFFGSTLDCQKENLIVYGGANGLQVTPNNTSGYKGVTWNKEAKKWRAQVWLNGKSIHLGTYATAEEAYAAHCRAVST
jgi:hypothetical protein